MEVRGCPVCLYQALPGSSPEPSPTGFLKGPFPDLQSRDQISLDLNGTSKMPPGAGKEGCPGMNGKYAVTQKHVPQNHRFGHPCRNGNRGDWDRPKYSKKQAAFANGLWVLMLVLSCIITFQAVRLPAVPGSSDAPSARLCPPDWKENEGRCYFFSDVEQNWTFSRSHCSSYGASLVTLDNQKEMDYVLRTVGHKLYWIGLQREDVREPWRSTNGSLFNNWFPVRLDGLCAYLAKDSVRSTSCFLIRFWICSKVMSSSERLENPD